MDYHCIFYTSMCVSLHTICSLSSMLKSWASFSTRKPYQFLRKCTASINFLSFKWDINIYTPYIASVLSGGRRMLQIADT